MKNKILFTLLLAILFSFTAYAAEEVGHAASLTGRVDIFRSQDPKTAVPLHEDEVVFAGDSIRTKSGSKAQLEFKDRSVLRIAQNSKVVIKQYSLDHKNERKAAAIEVSRGKVRAVISKMKDVASFIITTPNAEGTVIGSDIVVSYQAGNSFIFVNQGRMSVVNIVHPEKSVSVSAGSSVIILQKDLPVRPRPFSAIEKKMNEEETRVPASLAKAGKVSVIRGTVTEVSGDVKVFSGGSGRPHNAKTNETVGEGDTVETGANGYIEIRLDNNNAINLKPATKLTIIKLLFNPSNAEFENIFEVTIGNIKARIEGLNGNSRFEVKTPTAICGARGTIIYVNVFQNYTVGFFEGGDGYMTNPISGNTQGVGAGLSSTSDNMGNITMPVYVPDMDRQSYDEGWDAGGGSRDSAGGERNDAMDLLNEGGIRTDPGLSTLENFVDSPIPSPVFVSVPITQADPALLPVVTKEEPRYQPPRDNSINN